MTMSLKTRSILVVLIVDDSAEVAEVTSALFEQLGYDTIYRDSAGRR
jgi:CheY-like chemotaxis protein